MDAPTPSKANPARRLSGERDPERTRAAILAAAMEEFTTHGLNGARVDEIAKRSGVNKRMIYYYFGDKNGVYLAVLEEIYADIRNAEIRLHLAIAIRSTRCANWSPSPGIISTSIRNF